MAYSKEQKTKIINTICKEIAENGRALRTVLKDEGMPDANCFYRWIDADEKKREQYARATELRADKLVEDMITISDDQENDTYTDEDGNTFTNHNVIQRSRLRVDTRKWIASKLKPKKYGDKQTTVHEGGDKPIEISFED